MKKAWISGFGFNLDFDSSTFNSTTASFDLFSMSLPVNKCSITKGHIKSIQKSNTRHCYLLTKQNIIFRKDMSLAKAPLKKSSIQYTIRWMIKKCSDISSWLPKAESDDKEFSGWCSQYLVVSIFSSDSTAVASKPLSPPL